MRFRGRAAITAVLFAALMGVAPAPVAAVGAQADHLGSMAGVPLKKPIVGMTSTPTGEGYWLVASDGGIFSFGDAEFHGSTGAIVLNKPIVGIASTPTGEGYWLVASDGGIFAFGDATFHGSTGGMAVPGSIVGIAVTNTGEGYWLAGSDGSVYPFGDALDHGDVSRLPLKKPIVGVATAAYGSGFWLVASDGGIFAFGDATFHGSTGAIDLVEPIIAIVPHPHGYGYWLVAADGGMFAFGSTVGFFGSVGGQALPAPVVGAAAAVDGFGYWIAGADGEVYAFSGSAPGPRGGLGLAPRRIPTDSAPLRLMTLGDSLMISLQDGLDAAMRDTGRAVVIKQGRWGYGFTASWKPIPPCIVCFAVPEYGPELLSTHTRNDNYDAVVMMVGAWDSFGRRVDGQSLVPFAPEWRRWYRRVQDDAINRLSARGGVVAWLGYPTCVGTNPVWKNINDHSRDAAARFPGKAVYLDLTAEVCPDGPVLPLTASDGSPVQLLDETNHFTLRGARWVGDWIRAELGPTFKLPAA